MCRIVINLLSVSSNDKWHARLKNGALALLTAVCLFALPVFAHAECGSFGAPRVTTTIKMPPTPHSDFDFPTHLDHPTVVGLWHVIYTADGSTFNDTFDTWHADGTEFETAYLPAASGNVCVGVWVPTGRHGVKLHHIGWLFSPATPMANATNYFTLDEEVVVAEDNKTYSGKFTFRIWTLDGATILKEVSGTMAATRITVGR